MDTTIQLIKYILETSLFASAMIFIVLLIRAIAKDKVNIKLISMLWLIVILRLCLPGMLESPVHVDGLFPEKIATVEQTGTPRSSSTIEGKEELTANHEPKIALPDKLKPLENTNITNGLIETESDDISLWEKITNFILFFDLWFLASIVWIVGGAIILLSAIKDSIIFGFHVKKNCDTVKDQAILDIVNSHKRTIRIKREIKITTCAAIQMPLVIGILRPNILLPTHIINKMDHKYLYTILLHEVYHIKRNDVLKNYIIMFAKALHWFNPLVWIGIKKMKEDMEFACDQQVFSQLDNEKGLQYCESLIQAARYLKKRKVPQFASSLCEKKSNLKERIIKMISPKKKSKSIATITTLLAIVMAITCFTTACQPTPDDAAVIQKDNFEDLIKNTAQPTTQTSMGTENITWEDNFTKEYPAGNSTKITVNVDAPIEALQNTGSIFSVEPNEYDLDFAKKAVDYFLGDEYYDDIYTKDDFMKMILPLQQAILSMEDIAGSKGDAENRLEFYQRQYERAPEDNEPGEIAFEKARFDYIGLKGYPYDGAVSELYVGNGGMGYTNFYYVVQDGSREYEASNYEYSGIPARNMETSYEDAKKIADDAIFNLYGDNMSLVQTDLYNVYPIDNTYGSAARGLLDNSCPQCYLFTFTPIYGGLPQLYAPEAKNLDDMTAEGVAMYEQKWDFEYNMKWPAQYIQVLVDDNGIVQFWGFSPTKTTATVNESVAMQSFDEIFERFKKNIFYCSVWSDSGLEEVNISIDKIVFGMIRVPVKDNPDKYYMIPAWQFVGSKEELHVAPTDDLPDEVKEELELFGNGDYSESGKTFLVLNALDGSIIDTSYYINVKGDLEKTIGVSK